MLPGGKVITQTDSRLEKTYDMPYEEALAFYKEALKEEKDIKFRDRGWHTFIEDHKDRPWHAITVSKRARRRWGFHCFGPRQLDLDTGYPYASVFRGFRSADLSLPCSGDLRRNSVAHRQGRGRRKMTPGRPGGRCTKPLSCVGRKPGFDEPWRQGDPVALREIDGQRVTCLSP